MADVQPTPISEITNVKGDADLYGGGTASVIPVSPSAQYSMEAAQAQAAANKFFTEQHYKNIADVTSATNGMDLKDVLPQDLPDISNNYAQWAKDVADNYGVLSDPTSNIQKYSELKQRQAALQTQIATSKAHNAVWQENQKALLLHPELNTDENQQAMTSFVNTPSAQRKNFLLKAPTVFDPAAAAKVAIDSTKQLTDNEDLTKGGTYIRKTTGTHIDPDQYLQNYLEGIKSHVDSYGRTDYQNLQKLYQNIPVDANGQKESFDDYVKGVALHALPKDFQYISIKPNEAKIKADELNEKYWQAKLEASTQLARIAQDDRALKQGQIKPEEGAEAKNLLLWNAVHGKGVAPEFGQNIYGSDPALNIKVVSGGDTPTKEDPFHHSPKITEEVPRKQYVSMVPDANGGFILNTVDNSLDADGKLVSQPQQEYLTFEQAYSDFNGLYGHKYSPQIASGSSAFNKKKLGVTAPAIEDLDKYFDPEGKYKQAPAAAAIPNPGIGALDQYFNPVGKEKQATPAPTGGIPTINNDSDFNALPKGAKFIAADGKTYTKN